MPFAATWMQTEHHINWSRSEKERQILYAITYRWNLKYDMNKPMNKPTKQTHGHREQKVAKGKGIRGGAEREAGVS